MAGSIEYVAAFQVSRMPDGTWLVSWVWDAPPAVPVPGTAFRTLRAALFEVARRLREKHPDISALRIEAEISPEVRDA